MTDQTKQKIISLVKTYKELMPDEYEATKEIVRGKRANQIHGGDLTKTNDFVERSLCEYPANLWDMINAQLDVKEMMEFSSKPGARWFTRTFSEFSLVDKI